MGEKRRLKRKHLIYYLSVFDRNTAERIGQLVNITTEGIMLTTEEPMESGLIFQMKMVLPEEIKGIEEVTFDARSMWCRKSVNPDFYDIGFQLLDISTEHTKIVQNLIYSFSFQS